MRGTRHVETLREGVMIMIHNRRGTGLIDAMLSIFLLGTAGIVFSASFPAGFNALSQSSEATRATALAQQKIEQVRSLEYAKLTYDNLVGRYIDVNPISSPYEFTAIDSVGSGLLQGTGTLTISEDGGNVKRIVVSVNWHSRTGIARNVTLTTLVADSTPWVKTL